MDHPDTHQTRRTFAHNLVMIDDREQQTAGRGGSFHLFSVTPQIKVMEASSDAYGRGSRYRRTCVLVDHGQAGSYVVDIFRAGGGATRDYVFHGPDARYETKGMLFAPAQADSSFHSLPLQKLRTASGESPWSIRWELPRGYEFRALSPGHPGELRRRPHGAPLPRAGQEEPQRDGAAAGVFPVDLQAAQINPFADRAAGL